MVARKLTLALLATAAIGLTGVAKAADVYTPPAEPAYVPEPEAFSWTGIYFGINGGFGGNKFVYPYELYAFELDPTDVFTGEASITSSGFFAGGQVGGNVQFGSLLLGIEADLQWANITGELNVTNDNILLDVSGYSTVNWFGTIRGRAGFLATPRFLAYVTGGAAYGEVESGLDFNIFGGGGGESVTSKQWGWTAGGGFEYAITDHITFKTEYLYVDLGSYNLLDLEDGIDFFTIDAETTFHTVKAGFNLLW